MAKRRGRSIRTTRTAIRTIRSASLRRAFTALADGADYGLKNRDRKLALRCVGHLMTLTISLARIIKPHAAARMMHALVSDAQQFGLNLGGFGYETKDAYACTQRPYEYVCSESTGSTCMEDDS